MGRPEPMAAAGTRPAAPAPGGAGWLARAREAAGRRAEALGLPTRRDEYWRFTNPAPLLAAAAPDLAPPARAAPGQGAAAAFAAIAAIRLVFRDGVLDAAASDDPRLGGVEILSLAEAARAGWAGDLYGRLEAGGQAPVPRPLAAANTAGAGAGLLIRAGARAARPVMIVYERSSGASDAILHHCVKLDAGSALTLVEVGTGAARLSVVTEVEVGAGAVFHHLRAQGPEEGAVTASHLFARLEAGAELRSFTLTANGALTRNEAFVELAGPGGLAHLAGAALGDGAFHQDDTVFVRHLAEACESRQVFKKVLRHGATGVFQGKIHVLAQAQKTDGYQLSQALLLDEDARFLAKPELEIYADDVRCSHGSTAGAIEAGALFYLRARGLPRAEAEALLVLAFLAEAVAEIAEPDLARAVEALLEDWIGRHRG